MLGFIWSLIVGGVLGAIGGMILGKDVPGGMIGNIIVGFLGSWSQETLNKLVLLLNESEN